MNPENWETLKEIFYGAVALAPNERAVYLERLCRDDLALRTAVESLLKSHEETGNFVDMPAFQAAAAMLVDKEGLEAGQTVAHYRILSLLGEGGMGKVYLAEDTKLHRRVALKFLASNVTRDRERLRRFEQEARAVSALNHPNILTIYEISEVEGRRFIATEFIEGQTLRERRGSELSIDDALNIAIQVASGLAAAHRVNFVHRDIKPDNIMIRREDGLVKVLDFGLAKANPRIQSGARPDSDIATQLLVNTVPGVVVGTVAYMSPEQARGDAVDERTDIWSLGVVLYEMIAGCLPFVGTTSNEIISAIISKNQAPPLARYAHQVPERLEEIVEKALSKNRDERYQTVKDLLIDLQRLRQRAEVQAAIERSASPGQTEIPTSGGQASDEKSVRPGADTSTIKTTSSAEYIVNQVKGHKRGASIILAVLLLAIVTGGIVYRWRWRPTTTTQPEIKSLAVLPLKSLDSGENYLGLGIADAVIRRISQTGELIVRPTSAVRRYLSEETDGLTAAKQLEVDSVLEGTFQRADDRLRVSVNLLRASDGASLWTEKFDMRMADVFTIQDSISQEVAARLQLKLTSSQQAHLGKRYTSNAEAYEYYVKGRTNFEEVTTAIGDRQAIDAAITYFKKATELDPKYALAFAELGESYMWMANFNDPDNPVWIDLARQALSQAEAIDPQLAEIHSGRFEYYFSKYGGWNLSQAAREARQALALNPGVGHLALGTIYDHLGLDETTGLKEFQRALEIDPTSTFAQGRLVESYQLYGKFDDAIEASRHFFGEVGPDMALIGKGRLDEAQPLVEAAVKKNSGDLRARARLALILALRGRLKEAEVAIPPILEEARNNRAYHHVTYDIACVYALDGKTDEAVKWLRTTADTGMPNYPLFARDPHLDRIRKEPAFIQFMTELKKRWDGYKQEFERIL